MRANPAVRCALLRRGRSLRRRARPSEGMLRLPPVRLPKLQVLAQELARGTAPAFMLNHLTYLADHACAIPKRAELDSAVEARVRELIGEHARCCAIWAYMIAIRHTCKHIPESTRHKL